VSGAVIIGAGESPYTRHPSAEHETEVVLTDAVVRALADAGVHRDDVDGLAVCSFTLQPDHAVDLAWRLGMRLSWLMEDTNGGASGVNMLQHAVRAIEAGDASIIVLVAGDRLLGSDYEDLYDLYNKATRDYLAPIQFDGPNTMFSFFTQEHMDRFGMERADYGHVSIAQRWWAGKNPGAVYRAPMTMEEYLDAPPVAPPLHRYDCVPPVTGGDAIVVATPDRVGDRRGARVLAVQNSFNFDNQEGDGLTTGLTLAAPRAYEQAGVRPEDLGAAFVYDDYPVMALVQLADMGLIPDGDPKRFVNTRLADERWAVNTSGGQLSAGQAGAAAGMHGIVEAVTQLRGHAGERQIDAEVVAVSGYGMVLYNYGACAGMAVLERAWPKAS
jgi:acetyl-CoA acetyltransferase